MASSTVLLTRVPADSSRIYSATLVDANGVPINSATVSNMTVTLKDVATGNILNGRNAQNCLNANGGVLAANGAFSLTLTAADNIPNGTVSRYQERRLTFKVTYSIGVENHEVVFTVDSLPEAS